METNLAYAYQEEERFEIVNGKVVMMSSASSSHNRVSGNIYHMFRNYLQGRPCEPFPDGEALYLEDGKEEYQPDMMVVCDPEKVKADGVHGAPDLVVEVLSPSTGKNDRTHKKDAYERHGVREYWLVNPADRTLEQYALESGRFVLRDLYYLPPEYLLRRMTDAEKRAVVTEFQSPLFDGLTVRLDDVFYRVTPAL